MAFALALVVALLCATACAFQIIADAPTLYTVYEGGNGTRIKSGRQLTARCDSADYGLTRSYSVVTPSGKTGEYNITDRKSVV